MKTIITNIMVMFVTIPTSWGAHVKHEYKGSCKLERVYRCAEYEVTGTYECGTETESKKCENRNCLEYQTVTMRTCDREVASE